MALKKKASNTSAVNPMPQDVAVVSQAQGNSNKEYGLLEGVVDGELEVNLDDLGVFVEDIRAFQRIEARLAKASQRARQAVEAAYPLAVQMQTRLEGKGRQQTEAEAQE